MLTFTTHDEVMRSKKGCRMTVSDKSERGADTMASAPHMVGDLRWFCSGFSYIEVLVATVLVAMSLVPALEALQTGILGSRVYREVVEQHHHLQARLEKVLAEPMVALEAAALAAGSPIMLSSYSEPPGTDRRLLVYLSRYDGDNADSDDDPFTGTDAGLLWLRVEIENSPDSVETLVSRTYPP